MNNVCGKCRKFNCSGECVECYTDEKVTTVKWIYAIFIVIWIIVILLFKIYTLPFPVLLTVPVILFAIAFINASKLSEDVESEMSKIVYFPLIIIIAINVIIWCNKNQVENIKLISTCIIISMIFLLISSLDLWINRCWIFAYRHVQSAFETMAVGLIIYSLIAYGVSFKFS